MFHRTWMYTSFVSRTLRRPHLSTHNGSPALVRKALKGQPPRPEVAWTKDMYAASTSGLSSSENVSMQTFRPRLNSMTHPDRP